MICLLVSKQFAVLAPSSNSNLIFGLGDFDIVSTLKLVLPSWNFCSSQYSVNCALKACVSKHFGYLQVLCCNGPYHHEHISSSIWFGAW